MFSILTVRGLKMAPIKFFLQRGEFGLNNNELFEDDIFRLKPRQRDLGDQCSSCVHGAKIYLPFLKSRLKGRGFICNRILFDVVTPSLYIESF